MSGARSHRHGLTARAGDHLPTGALISAVKASAIEVMADRIAAMPWPPNRAAHEVLDMAPLVALGALIELCPAVMSGRLARCLGLDPLDAVDELRRADDAAAVWIDVARVVAACKALAS